MPEILLEADNSDVKNKLINELKVDPDYAKKLLALGKPFEDACKILGYKITNENGGNPILAFVLQQKNLINSGLLNLSTFKAIYNAVVKQLVADSEFFVENNYNIIYCKHLYKKTPLEMEEYLKLQSEILKPSAEIYSAKDQETNRKTFLYIQGVLNNRNEEELNITKRAAKINDSKNKYNIPTVKAATKLNSIELAKAIKSKNNVAPLQRSADELDKIIAKLKDTASKYAAILMLCSSNSNRAKEALNHPKFQELEPRQITNAFMELSQENIIPRGQLRTDVANLLVQKILATFEQ